jgi:Zn-dependent protease with chaperone function
MTDALYFDGHSTRVHPARIAVRDGEILISGPQLARIYPLGGGPAGTVVAEPFAQAPLMLRFADGARCEVPFGPGRPALLAALGYRSSRVERWQAHWPAAMVALVLLLAALGAAWFAGIPWAAERIAARLPVTVDTSLGHAALRSLERQGIVAPSRLSDERVADVEALLPRALPAHPRIPVRLLVRDGKGLGANALALPDGTLVVTDQMVKLAMRGGELDDDAKNMLVAVLGHEVGHLEHRHAARVLAGSSLTAAISATLFGDFSAVAAGVPTLLAQMQYSRDMEYEADGDAIALLRRAGIPLHAFAEMLGRLEGARSGQEQLPRWLRTGASYLSTHPDTAARIRRIDEAEAGVDAARPQLSGNGNRKTAIP